MFAQGREPREVGDENGNQLALLPGTRVRPGFQRSQARQHGRQGGVQNGVAQDRPLSLEGADGLFQLFDFNIQRHNHRLVRKIT